MSTRPLLFLVPHYVGSIRYYEKLLPHLSPYFDVRFLILYSRTAYPLMIAYAKDKGLPYLSIDPPDHRSILSKMPFYRTTAERSGFVKRIRGFLVAHKPAKIVSTNDQGFYMHALMEEADILGIDTMVLQWALMYPGQAIRRPKLVSLPRRIIYKIGKPIAVALRRLFMRLALGNRVNNWSKGVLGGGGARRFGVINKNNYDLLAVLGIPKEKMTIVGYMDFHTSRETAAALRTDGGLRRSLAKKYGIDSQKKNIVFYSTPFNRKDTAILTDEEQRHYTDLTIETIRAACPSDRYGILFKPHPSQAKEEYRYLAKHDVAFIDPLGDNNEIIALSDLYVAGVSTTNFIPLAMSKDAVFVNFARLPQIESARESFGIKQTVTSPDEFHSLLSRWKDGALEKQYSAGESIITGGSLKKILDWIRNE